MFYISIKFQFNYFMMLFKNNVRTVFPKYSMWDIPHVLLSVPVVFFYYLYLPQTLIYLCFPT